MIKTKKMLHIKILLATIFALYFFAFTDSVYAQSSSEILGRGLICLPKDPGAYCTWRLLPIDEANIGFNVYRSVAVDGEFTRVNPTSITTSTDYHDHAPPSTTPYYYKVRTVNNQGVEGDESNLFKVTVVAGLTTTHIDVPIGESRTIHAAVAGDLNADGMLDFVIKTPQWSACRFDNPVPQTKISSMLFEDGEWKRKWTFETEGFKECGALTGANHNPLLVWDLDGDLRAEVIARSGGYLGEKLIILDGMTGQIRASVPWPEHIPLLTGGKDADYAVIARLRDMNGDGIADPFIVVQSGIFMGHQLLTEYYFNGTTLEMTNQLRASGPDYYSRRGFGTHGLPAVDIDQDGKEEVIPCGVAIEDDLSVAWEAFDAEHVNIRHSDICYSGDIRPDLPGLETFMGEEDNATGMGWIELVGVNGNILWKYQANPALGFDGWTNGWCAELTTDYEGIECFGWEKDEQREEDINSTLVHVWAADGADITSRFFARPLGNESAIRQAPVDWIGGNGIKEMYYYGNPVSGALAGWVYSYFGDLFGDSREEVIGYNQPAANGFFRINVNTEQNDNHRRVTPLIDRTYRDALARIGVGYRTNYIPIETGQERTDVVYTNTPPICASFTYAPEACLSNGMQKLNIVTQSPSGCVNGIPVLTQSCTYISPRPSNEVDPRGTYIEAEDFTSTIPSKDTGSFVVESTVEGYFGEGYIKAQGNPGDPAITERKDYLLNFPQAGEYKIWVKGFAPNYSSDSVSFGMDGTFVDTIMLQTYPDQMNLWRWTTLRQERIPTSGVDLLVVANPGMHTLNLWPAESNLIIDGMYITDLGNGGKFPSELIHGKIVKLNSADSPADINSDGRVNIKDIQACIKAIVDSNSISEAYLSNCKKVAPPIETVNIKDIQMIIRKIINPN